VANLRCRETLLTIYFGSVGGLIGGGHDLWQEKMYVDFFAEHFLSGDCGENHVDPNHCSKC